MAIIKCPHCKKETISTSDTCLNCGAEITHKNIQMKTHSTSNNVQSKTYSTYRGYDIIFVFIGIVFIIFILVGLSKCSSSSGDRYWSTECDWCGKEEECKQYCVQILDGYNRDGSFKYKYEYFYFSNSCYTKAKNGGVQYGWINIVPTK